MSAEIKEQLDRIEAMVILLCAGKAPAASPAPASGYVVAPGAVADDAELDSNYGNPDVRKDPPRWKGDSFKGKKYSACSPEYLDALAGFLDWQAGKDDEKGTDDGKKYAGYARKDSARARGWAKRLRAGWKQPGREPGIDDEDEIPFS